MIDLNDDIKIKLRYPKIESSTDIAGLEGKKLVDKTFEMIGDCIENCIQYIKNFNPEKSSNPFAYFTQIIYYAFIRRIQKEKKQLYIKYKTMQSAPSLLENVEVSINDNVKGYNQETMNTDQKANMYNFIKNFEDAKKAKSVAKKPTKTTNLEYFMVA